MEIIDSRNAAQANRVIRKRKKGEGTSAIIVRIGKTEKGNGHCLVIEITARKTGTANR